MHIVNYNEPLLSQSLTTFRVSYDIKHHYKKPEYSPRPRAIKYYQNYHDYQGYQDYQDYRGYQE